VPASAAPGADVHVITRPTGVERTFAPDELIVTKTDLAGRLTYANDVFLRVSAFEESDVLGKPHNIIRHPSMPRAVFSLLWETLTQGHEMFAYVVNLAGDGAHYWVFAHVTPSFDDRDQIIGFHSSRRVPDRAALEPVQRLYARLSAAEHAHHSAADATAAGRAALQAELTAHAQTYDEHVWSLAGAVAR
jgi:PAS domain S-box-containing protein